MHRWYMPVFRQMIEWSILNTGVEMRERPNGKKLWSGLNLKLSIAQDLAFLGKKTDETFGESNLNSQQNSDDDGEIEIMATNSVRLRKDMCHVPEEQKKRLVCRVHKQRKLTHFYCSTCKKAMCLGICWRRYHTKKNYLFDDDKCTGKVIHTKNTDF